MNLELLRKVYQAKDNCMKNEDLVSIFGEMEEEYPTHLGNIDEELERVWLWKFKHYQVATVDVGNGWANILLIEHTN